jgi:type I restriction enzyme S subunit
MTTIGQEDIARSKVAFPSLPEQKKIADFLGAVDDKIAKLMEKKALLERYKKGMMQKLFSQSLRFKDENGQDYPDWEEKTFGELFSWVNTNSLSREKLTDETGTIQNIHYGDIHSKFRAAFMQSREPVPYIISAEAHAFKDDQFCKVGDVVIADASEDYADIGKSIEIIELNGTPLVAGLHTYIARPKSKQTAVGFFGHYLRDFKLRRQIMRIAQGISVLGVSKGNLEKLTLTIPHPAEQRKIADFLTAIDDKINHVSNELEQAKLFKKGLLQQMFV